MLYYKLELTKDSKFIVQDIVEDKVDDNYIYATEQEFSKIKPELIIDYNVDLLSSPDRSNTIRKRILRFINE